MDESKDRPDKVPDPAAKEPARNAQRATQPQAVAPRPELSDEERARLEARNGLLQFDAMLEKIRAGIKDSTGFRLRPSDILHLHRVATEGLQDDAGRFRGGPVEIHGTKHEPPPATDVPRLVDDLCDELRARWSTATPVHLAAYVMWRLNWIHPFSDGNGRTTRAVSYLVMCVRMGFEVPGTKAIPHLIAEDKFPYYDALDAADEAVKKGGEDVSEMEELLCGFLAAQLLRVHREATGIDPEAIYGDEDASNARTPPPA